MCTAKYFRFDLDHPLSLINVQSFAFSIAYSKVLCANGIYLEEKRNMHEAKSEPAQAFEGVEIERERFR